MSLSFWLTCGIVDDLADQVEPPVGELVPRLVGVIHRPLHPVAEAELPGQPEGERAHGEPYWLARSASTTALW